MFQIPRLRSENQCVEPVTQMSPLEKGILQWSPLGEGVLQRPQVGEQFRRSGEQSYRIESKDGPDIDGATSAVLKPTKVPRSSSICHRAGGCAVGSNTWLRNSRPTPCRTQAQAGGPSWSILFGRTARREACLPSLLHRNFAPVWQRRRAMRWISCRLAGSPHSVRPVDIR